MNSYNENLRSTVLSALSTQELELKKLTSQKSAALFRLYYAEGAVLTANQDLEAANRDKDSKAKAKKQAVNGSALANNQLTSATQADQYTRLSVSNAAVCAANVQVAANAIVRLAADIGSIFSILQAAGQGSALHKSAAHIRDLINDTAYHAEIASSLAMQASMLTAEVSSATVLDQSKSTNELMDDLLKVCLTDFTTASQAAAAAKDQLETVVISSNIAEGDLQAIAVETDAAALAYQMMNKQLNLDLTVRSLTDNNFTVRFAPITRPFEPNITSPVAQAYSIIVVKDSKKATFEISNAEAILEEGAHGHRLIPIPEIKPEVPCSYTVNFKDIVLRDADGDEIRYGQSYVVFLLAVYTQAYKKEINNFDNYLSASSDPFVLTVALPKALITTKPTIVTPKKTQARATYTVKFRTQKNPLSNQALEYRCILLLASQGPGMPNLAFDLSIAQQIPAGNYTVATADVDGQYTAAIGSGTTDNFGNPLIKGTEYDILILTTSAATVEDTGSFCDALSDRDIHSTFQYQIKYTL